MPEMSECILKGNKKTSVGEYAAAGFLGGAGGAGMGAAFGALSKPPTGALLDFASMVNGAIFGGIIGAVLYPTALIIANTKDCMEGK